jgi:Winged helix DNA-binding domain
MLSWAQVCARRLERHFLARPAHGLDPAAVAGVICGVHAQVMSAAEMSLALRLEGAGRADVRDALWATRSLIKTYGPRGTVHLLPARDLPMWTGALSAMPPATGSFPEHVRLTAEQTDEVVAAIGAVLADAALTVDEMDEAVAGHAGTWAGERVMPAFQGLWPRWRQAITVAAHRGVLCFGPNRGAKVTYTRPPGLTPLDGPAAAAELIRRYLHAYGPATPQQFAQWLAAPRRWTADLFATLAPELDEVNTEDGAAWIVAGDTAMPADRPSGVRLLPYFDAYIVGSHPRPLLFPGPASRALSPSGSAGNFPVLLVDGAVAGVWHQRRAGKKIDVTVEPIGRLSAVHRRELDVQVERVARILEGRPELTIGPIPVGPHA